MFVGRFYLLYYLNSSNKKQEKIDCLRAISKFLWDISIIEALMNDKNRFEKLNKNDFKIDI